MQIRKFGEKYREIFKSKNLENLYCLKEMDVTLEGHTPMIFILISK